MGADQEKSDNLSHRSVQARLLDAAEEHFAEHGFERTSIRELAAAAKCNLASVNYYFGGKEKLYLEVWRRLLVRMREARVRSIRRVMEEAEGVPALEELLRAFAMAFIEPLADEARARRMMKLMAREMLDQHLPASMFSEEIIAPTLSVLQDALRRTCPGIDESKIVHIVLSIAGQLMHITHIKGAFEEAGATAKLGKLDINEAVEHVVKFSAAGIRAYAEEKNSAHSEQK